MNKKKNKSIPIPNVEYMVCYDPVFNRGVGKSHQTLIWSNTDHTWFVKPFAKHVPSIPQMLGEIKSDRYISYKERLNYIQILEGINQEENIEIKDSLSQEIWNQYEEFRNNKSKENKSKIKQNRKSWRHKK